MGGLVFEPPDLRLTRITRMTLRIWAGGNLNLRPGQLSTGGYLFNSISDANPLRTFSRSVSASLAQFHEFNVLTDSHLLMSWPARIAFSVLYEPNNGFDVLNFTVAQQQIPVIFSSCELVIGYETFSPLPPDTLHPNGVVRHPNSNVELSWRFNPNLGITNDQQSGSRLSYRINAGAFVNVELGNTLNSHTFPSGKFSAGNVVEWQVQTISVLGASAHSEIAQFTLAETPPLAPSLVHPVNVAVDAASGVLLEWRYNSQFDLRASRFDIRYRFNEGPWLNLTTSGDVFARTSAVTTQGAVEWQVRATGQQGDLGPWSEIERFWTIGAPPAPNIVGATRTNRPLITFSTANIMSWEMEFFDERGNIVHSTGDVAFLGQFTYRLPVLLMDGNYIVRMRVRNEFGLYSPFSSLAFAVRGEAIQPVSLDILDLQPYGITLLSKVNTTASINNYELMVYRTERGSEDFAIIAHLRDLSEYIRVHEQFTEIEFVDFTAGPGIDFVYFVRLVGHEGNGFSDSGAVNGRLDFRETVIMRLDGSGAVKLSLLADSPEAKVMESAREVDFIRVLGRDLPVAEVRGGKSRRFTMNFLCNMTEHEALAKLAQCGEPLCFRDFRFGTAMGFINSLRTIAADPAHVLISFEFLETEVRHD